MDDIALNQRVDDFFDSIQDGDDDYDETDKAMVAGCLKDDEFRDQMANNSNPWLRDLMRDFDRWNKSELRKEKIRSIIDEL